MRRRRDYNNYNQGSMYDYQGPSTSQYESFFEPIPLEFLQGISDKHQAKYDNAYATSVAAKNAYADAQVGNEDVMHKNELIKDFTNKVETNVAENYGGDWAKASKDIARMVTDVKQSPFWNYSANAQKERERQKGMIDKLGDKAYVVSDANRSVYDAETDSYNPVTSKVVDMSDWQKSVAQQFAGLRGNSLESLLGNSNIDGILQSRTVNELSDDELHKLSENPSIIESFYMNNPGFKQVHEDQNYTPDEINKKAADYIYGNIASREFKDVSYKQMGDPTVRDGGGGRNGANGTIMSNAGQSVKLKNFDRKVAAEDRSNLLSNKQLLLDIKDKTPAQIEMLKDIDRQLIEGKANSNYLFNSMQQDPEYKFAVKEAYDEYKNTKVGKGVKLMSEEQFTQVIQDNILSDDNSTSFGGMVMKLEDGETYSQQGLSRVARKAKKAFDKFIKEGNIAQSVNILTGTSGNKDVDTRVARDNRLLTDSWKSSTSEYTMPFSGMQTATYLEESGKRGKPYVDRDPTKDTMVQTDGSIDGKFLYQLNIYDKEGNPLGAEYVIPKNQSNIRGNLRRVGEDLLNLGYDEEAKQVLMNSQYGPVVQNAGIYTKGRGSFGNGVSYKGQELFYKNTGTKDHPIFKIFIIDEDGKDDLFPGSVTDENGLKAALYTIEYGTENMNYLRNLNSNN